MPLEIGEIGISMRVSSDVLGTTDDADDPEAAARKREEREELIDECVRRVLAVLRAERER